MLVQGFIMKYYSYITSEYLMAGTAKNLICTEPKYVISKPYQAIFSYSYIIDAMIGLYTIYSSSNLLVYSFIKRVLVLHPAHNSVNFHDIDWLIIK